MKIARIHSWGKSDVVKIDEVAVPFCNDDEVLVAVHAAAMNPVDWKVREGYFADSMKDPFPFPMGWDFSGTIEVAGKQSPYKKGEEVYGLIRFPNPAGCFAEYVVAPITEISRKPNSMDHNHAAGIPLVALTAWQALFDTFNLQSHQKVLIHAAGGGVGQIAVQLAKWKGAFVAATGSLATKELLSSLGVDQFIDYQKEKFEEKIADVDFSA